MLFRLYTLHNLIKKIISEHYSKGKGKVHTEYAATNIVEARKYYLSRKKDDKSKYENCEKIALL